MKKVWLLRPSPNDHNRMREFKEQNIIAIGWPELEDLSKITKYTEIKELLASTYGDTGVALGVHGATLDIFLNRMQAEDIVVVPDKNDIHFAVITSGYKCDESKRADGYCHQRAVQWLTTHSRDDLPESLRKALRVQRTATEIKNQRELFYALAYGTLTEGMLAPEVSYVTTEYPLRTNLNLKLQIPSDITREEAERLGEFIKRTYFRE